MYKSHKIRLKPNNKQASHLMRACGVARFSYNWALGEWNKQYAAHAENPELPKPSQYSLRKQLNSIKRIEFPWMMEVTKCAPQSSIIDLGDAFKSFWSGRGKYPQFKKRGSSRDSFQVDGMYLSVSHNRIRIPNLGWIRMSEELRFPGKISYATISRTSNQWFVSITANTPDRQLSVPEQATGVDVGVKDLAILSTGEVFPTQASHKNQLARLRKLNKELHRRVKGSANRKKTQTKLASLHAKIARQRLDGLHKLTTKLADSYSIIGIEDLNVKGMVKNRSLARAISDQGFGEFRRQLEYKTQERKTDLVIVDRWFPSSKLCSECGFKNQELTLKVRNWTCGNCGSVHDRDMNAANNLEQEALRILGKSTASSAWIACGDGSAGLGGLYDSEVKLPSVKQESNFDFATSNLV